MECEAKLSKYALLCALLSCLLFCSGCITARNLSAAQKKPRQTVPDRVDGIDGAWVTPDNQLLLFVKARLTNSPTSGHYTLTIPLAKARMHTPIYPWDTNWVAHGELFLPHDLFREAGASRESERANWKAVPVGLPLAISGAGPVAMENVERYKPLPGETRTLYLAVESSREATPTEFIYVDTTRPECFTWIQVEPVTFFTESKKARYWLTPLTVVGDLATSPFQLLFWIYVAAGGFVA